MRGRFVSLRLRRWRPEYSNHRVSDEPGAIHYHETYRALKARNGNSQIKAMCAVARKLVPMLLVIMQTGRLFDAATWRSNRLERPEQAA